MAYIDGFNLYYGLRDSGFRRYFWLDVHALSKRLIRKDQTLIGCKYFTARIGGSRPTDGEEYASKRDAKRSRQTMYLDALKVLREVTIFHGQFIESKKECLKCHATWWDAEEKMTDVSIATEMLVDAFANNYDVALLISADSDLVPPIEAIKKSHGHKRINVAFPPGRNSSYLKRAADGQCMIYKGTLRKCQLPEVVIAKNGYELKRPESWQKTVEK